MRKSNSEHLAFCVDSSSCDSNTIVINSKRTLLRVLVLGTEQIKYIILLYYTILKNKKNYTLIKTYTFKKSRIIKLKINTKLLNQ